MNGIEGKYLNLIQLLIEEYSTDPGIIIYLVRSLTKKSMSPVECIEYLRNELNSTMEFFAD